MIHLLLDALPEHIEVDGRRYSVLTDFRDWIQFADMLADRSLLPEERAVAALMWVSDPPAQVTASLVKALLAFYRADGLKPPTEDDNDEEDDEEDVEDETQDRPPVFDWRVDAAYIVGDFRRYYGIDLLTVEYLHWWEFRALFEALPEDSQCMKRIGSRSCDLSKITNKAERQRIAAIQRQIRLPWEREEEAFGDALWESMMV